MLVTYKNPGFQYSVDSILLFQKDETASYWSDSLHSFFPQVNKEAIHNLNQTGKKEYLTKELKMVWDGLADELDRKVILYNSQFRKYHEQIEDALSDAFETDTRILFNDLTANICLNPISPRYLEEKYFDVFYMNSERGALGMTLHEIIHYIWFYVWNGHFSDSYSEYETPSLKWILSEMTVESIMSDERLASINPYYPGCVYSYFQDMIIDGKPVLDTLYEMYKGNQITDYMEKAYRYCQENEAAIRQHISNAEG